MWFILGFAALYLLASYIDNQEITNYQTQRKLRDLETHNSLIDGEEYLTSDSI